MPETGGTYRFDDPDPYLTFDGPVYDTTPRNFLPFIDTIKKESEWRSLGLAPKKDRSGNYKPIIRKGLYFGFHRKVSLSTIDREAIATGKKCTRDPDSVLSLLRQGIIYDDFVSLPEDVVAYCDCQKAADQGDLETALSHIKKAFDAKCDEVKYANAYFAVRLRLGDKSAIEEELTFFRQDIDCLVHSGRVYEWLKYLSSIKDYPGLRMTVWQIDEQLDALIAGQAQSRRHCPQPVEFYAHQKEQFVKKTAHLRKRIGEPLATQPSTYEDPEREARRSRQARGKASSGPRTPTKSRHR